VIQEAEKKFANKLLLRGAGSNASRTFLSSIDSLKRMLPWSMNNSVYNGFNQNKKDTANTSHSPSGGPEALKGAALMLKRST
jgi:hypothetical protein